jgi:hypothetical protein
MAEPDGPGVPRSVVVLVVAGLVVVLAGAGAAIGVVPEPDLDDDEDDDGLTDARERALGTDPNDPDTDGDRLPDVAELRGETDDGVALPGADPLRKDLYVQVDRGRRVPPLSERERAALVRAFATMPVDNPGGEDGIALHLVTDDADDLDRRVLVNGSRTRGGLLSALYSREAMGDRRCVYHRLVFGVVEDGTTVGYGGAPGYLSVVDGTALLARAGSTSLRVRYAVHELLHNVVGRLPDGRDHTDSGYLAHRLTDDSEESLSTPTRQALSGRGFAPPPRDLC